MSSPRKGAPVPRLLALTLATLLGLPAGPAGAQDIVAQTPPPDAPPPPPPPEPPPSVVDPARVDEVDQRARILERKLELVEEAAATRKAAEVVVTASDRGLNVKSADGAYSFRFRGLL